MMTTARHHLSKADAITVARIEASVPTLRHVPRPDRALCRDGSPRACRAAAGLVDGGGYQRGLRAEFEAVAAALRESWSNGQTEGQINRLKTLKRQMYGRANLDLLRARLVVVA